MNAFNFFMALLTDTRENKLIGDREGLAKYYLTIDRSHNVFNLEDCIYLGFNNKKTDSQSFIISILIKDNSNQEVNECIVHEREATDDASKALDLIKNYLTTLGE